MNMLMQAMPDRAFDVGIAEGHAATFSGGMAKEGMQPFCNIYSSFMQRAYDNVIHDIAILKLPVVLCLDRAGLVGRRTDPPRRVRPGLLPPYPQPDNFLAHERARAAPPHVHGTAAGQRSVRYPLPPWARCAEGLEMPVGRNPGWQRTQAEGR